MSLSQLVVLTKDTTDDIVKNVNLLNKLHWLSSAKNIFVNYDIQYDEILALVIDVNKKLDKINNEIENTVNVAKKSYEQKIPKPIKLVKKEKEDIDCCICLDKIEEYMYITNCVHKFCVSCLKRHYNSNRITKCPLCRNRLNRDESLVVFKKEKKIICKRFHEGDYSKEFYFHDEEKDVVYFIDPKNEIVLSKLINNVKTKLNDDDKLRIKEYWTLDYVA